ncbi:MAG: hypothetical protein ACP5NU_03500 [Methanomicrobiales archaeon]
MPENIKESVARLKSLLKRGDFQQFFSEFPHLVMWQPFGKVKDQYIKQLIEAFVINNTSDEWRDNQEQLIGSIFLEIRHLDDRIYVYSNIVDYLDQEHGKNKDQFLLDIMSVERSREIARFVYAHSDAFGKAHEQAVFFFLTGICFSPQINPQEYVIRLRSPQIQFIDSDHLQIRIPPQVFHKNIFDKEIVCEITTVSFEKEVIVLQKQLEGEKATTIDSTRIIHPSYETYRIALSIEGTIIRIWEIRGLTSDRPFMAFRDPSGGLIQNEVLPRERTWIISNRPLLLEQGILQKGMLTREWQSFYYYLINPSSNRDYYLKISDDELYRLPFFAPILFPSLIGPKIEEVIFDPPIPWYSCIPTLIVPYTEKSDDENITFELGQVLDSKSSTNFFNINLQRNPGYVQKDQTNRIYKIDLSHIDILGPSAAGKFLLRFLERGEIIEFCIAPNLEVLFHPPLVDITSARRSSVEVEVKGPTIVDWKTPGAIIRKDLIKIPLDGNFKTAVLQRKRIECDLGFDQEVNDSSDLIKLKLKLPFIRYSFEGLLQEKSVFTDKDSDLLLKEFVSESFETATIRIEKPKEFFGKWTLGIGIQESSNYSIDDFGNLSFPLSPFRETLLEENENPIPVVLRYLSKEKIADINLFSLLDWTVLDQHVSIEFDNDEYKISMTWKERGRSKPVFLTIFHEATENVPMDIEFDIVSLHPSKYDWREYTALLSVPMSVPEGSYSLGFVFNETEQEEWSIGPSVRYPVPIVLQKDPYEIAYWHFSRKEYEGCVPWIDRIPEDHTRYADALYLKAICTGIDAEKHSSISLRMAGINNAIQYINKAIDLDGAKHQYSLIKSHLYNRIGFYDGQSTEFYKKAKEILIPVLGNEPHSIGAITEYGISLMGISNLFEAMKIFQLLQFLDPKENDSGALWGKAMLFYYYSMKRKGSLGQRDKKTIQNFLEKAKQLDKNNPLYDTLQERMESEFSISLIEGKAGNP